MWIPKAIKSPVIIWCASAEKILLMKSGLTNWLRQVIYQKKNSLAASTNLPVEMALVDGCECRERLDAHTGNRCLNTQAEFPRRFCGWGECTQMICADYFNSHS